MRARITSHSHLLLSGKICPLDLCKHNQQSEQDQRLDQRQSQNHHRLDLRSSSRVAGSAFTSCRTNSRLAQCAANYCDRESYARSNCLKTSAFVRRVVRSSRRSLSERNRSAHQDADNGEKKHVQFSHILFLLLGDAQIKWTLP